MTHYDSGLQWTFSVLSKVELAMTMAISHNISNFMMSNSMERQKKYKKRRK